MIEMRGTVTSQKGAVETSSFVAPMMGDPLFVDVANFDVHLKAGSPCIDQGTDPGADGARPLAPMFEYLQPLSMVPRTVVGAAIDIGAYEYGNGAAAPDMGSGADLAATGNSPDGGGPGAPDLASAGSGNVPLGTPKSGGCAVAPGRRSGKGDSPLGLLLALIVVMGSRGRKHR